MFYLFEQIKNKAINLIAHPTTETVAKGMMSFSAFLFFLLFEDLHKLSEISAIRDLTIDIFANPHRGSIFFGSDDVQYVKKNYNKCPGKFSVNDEQVIITYRLLTANFILAMAGWKLHNLNQHYQHLPPANNRQ